ncbi:MAG: PAS domain S-box protein, partial [Candidatus Binatia bacterium]
MSTARRHRATPDAVARSEARFRALIQYSSDVLTLLDPGGTVLYNAPAVQVVLGWDPEELIGQKAFDYIHPDDLAHVGAQFAEALQQPGVAVPVTFRFRHRDGRWIYLEAIGSNRLDDPNVRGVVVNSRDITERMRVEEHLRKTQQLHQLLIEQVPVGILFTDPAGRITSANPAALAIFGSPSEDATKQFNVLTMEQLQRTGVSAAYQRVLQEHTTERVEMSYLSFWGRRADLRLVIAPLYDHPGRLLGTVSIVEDLTDRTRADREKAALLDIARDISGTLDQRAILDRVHERAAALLPCDVVATWLYDPARGLRAVAQRGLPEAIAAEAADAALERGHPLVEALAGGQTVVINDVGAQDWLPAEALQRLGIQAAVLAPLIVRGLPTGAIAAFRRGEAVAFTGHEVQLFEGIARQVALMLGAAALHRAEQEEAAISTALARVGRELISAVSSSPALLAQLCAVTARVLACDRAHTMLFEPRDRVW